MKSAKLGMTITSLITAASMLLAACGADPTATPLPAPTATTAQAAQPTATSAGEAATATTAPVEATATSGGGSTTFTGDTIKIGIDLPTSGADASSGVPARNGAELAIDQANAKGGVTIGGKTYKLEMYALDDAINGVHNPEQGAKNAQAFISDPAVLGVLGPFNSNVARAMMPVLNNAGLVNISPSNTGPGLTKEEYGEVATLRPTGKVTYFRVCATDDFQGPAAADFMYNELKLKNIYILDDTETYGKGIADQVNKQFVKDGGTVVAQDGVPKGTTDFRTILTKIAGASPAVDGIFYGGTTSNGLGLARKQMEDAGLDIPFMGGDGIQEAQFLTDAGDNANGSYATVAAVDSTTLPQAQQFFTDYDAKYGKDQRGAYSAPMYDAANILIAAMVRAGKPDREAVRVAMLDGTKYDGTIGETSFDANGDTTNKWISVYGVKDGAWTFVSQQQFKDSGSDSTTPAATATTGGSGSTVTFSGDTIKIGIDLPTSGADASSGVPARNGAELAIDQANAKGGVTIGGKTYKLEMYALDDAINGVHNPEQGAKNAQAFISDPAVLGVLGPFNSNVARAMMPVLNNAGLVNISPSNTGPGLTKEEYGEVATLRPTGKVTYFRVCATDDFQGPAAADFMYNELKLKNIYILDDTETYGKGIADQVNKQFVKDGGTVVAQDGVPKGTTDFRTILTKIAGASPAVDGIFYGGTTSNGLGLARKQMEDAGLDIPFMGGDGIQEAQFLTDAGDNANGSYATVAAVDSTTLPQAQQFYTDYDAKYGKDQRGAYSAPMYDAANILIAAMVRAGSPDRESVRKAMLDGTKYDGTIGETSFDANGDTTNRWISVYGVKDGAWTFVSQSQFK